MGSFRSFSERVERPDRTSNMIAASGLCSLRWDHLAGIASSYLIGQVGERRYETDVISVYLHESRKDDQMIPNWEIALKALASINTAANSTRPDWTMAQTIWDDELDYATHPLWERVEPGRAPTSADPRIDQVRIDVERLHRALLLKDRITVDSLLISIEEEIRALSTEPIVA